MKAAPRRVTLYPLPDLRVAPTARVAAVRPVPDPTAHPYRRPSPPRTPAMPAGVPSAEEGIAAETLSALAGVQGYTETQQQWALRHEEPRDSGSRLDLRL
jgi:hypothetical protein